jgi:hypothetical protein
MNSGFSRYHINWNNTTAVSKCLKARRILENVLLTWIDDTVSNSDYVASNGRVWKTTTSWPNLWHYPGNFSEGVKKSRKTSMRTVGVPAEIRIGYFPNTSQRAIPFELICFVILEKKNYSKTFMNILKLVYRITLQNQCRREEIWTATIANASNVIKEVTTSI